MGRFSRSFSRLTDILTNLKARGVDVGDIKVNNKAIDNFTQTDFINAGTGVRAEFSETITVKVGDQLVGKSLDEQVDLLSDISGKPKSEINAKINKKSVSDAAENPKWKKKLTSWGLKGAAGVVLIMLITGESNPIEALREFGEMTGEAVGGLADFIGSIKDFFTSYGVYISISCVLLILMLVIVSVM